MSASPSPGGWTGATRLFSASSVQSRCRFKLGDGGLLPGCSAEKGVRGGDQASWNRGTRSCGARIGRSAIWSPRGSSNTPSSPSRSWNAFRPSRGWPARGASPWAHPPVRTMAWQVWWIGSIQSPVASFVGSVDHASRSFHEFFRASA